MAKTFLYLILGNIFGILILQLFHQYKGIADALLSLGVSVILDIPATIILTFIRKAK